MARRSTPSRGGLTAALGLVAGLLPGTAAAAPTQPGELVNDLDAPYGCELCHGYENPVVDENEPEYSQMRSWQGSLMANSARDPVFWAGLAVADADAPGHTELCIRCHAPRAFLDGHGSVTAYDQLLPDEQEGVECTLCHRMVEDPTAPLGNAQYTIDDSLIDGVNVARRGPWDYTDGVPAPDHAWLYDAYQGSSRMCGTCHDVTTEAERVDDMGVGLGVNFNEQRTYSEWAGSAYAVPGPDFQTCQGCHMPAVPDKPGCNQYLNSHSHPAGGVRHDLVGANRFVVELLQAEFGAAGANLIADFYFENTLAAMDALLPTAATLEVQGPPEVDLAAGLPGLAVTVTNNTGHKLPTGYSEGRMMWLEVLAEYDGQRVYSSGAWDQATGLERDAQLRTYEGLAERWSDGTTFHLLLNDHWVEDTRIPPRGLLPDLQTDPVGGRYTLLPDGTWPHYDEHGYDFPASDVVDATPDDPGDDVLQVTVRLRYLINSPEYIDLLALEGGDAGLHVATLFDLAGGAPPLTIAQEQLQIPIAGFGAAGTTGADTTAGETSGSSSTTTAATTTTGSADSTGAGPTGPAGSTGPGTTASDASTGGTAAAGEGEGSCQCRSGAPRTGLWLLPLLGLAIRRRPHHRAAHRHQPAPHRRERAHHRRPLKPRAGLLDHARRRPRRRAHPGGLRSGPR